MNNEENSLLKVRELIFGEKMSEYTNRFAETIDLINELKREQSQDLEQTKNEFNHEITSLKELLNTQSIESSEEIIELKKKFEAIVDKLGAKHVKSTEKLSQQIESKSNDLTLALANLSSDISKQLQLRGDSQHEKMQEIKTNYVSKDLLSKVFLDLGHAFQDKNETPSKSLN